LLTAVFASIAFADRCAAAESAMTTCGGVEISIVEVGDEVGVELRDFSQLDARPRLIVVPTPTAPDDQRTPITTVTALGPMLGTMDSSDVDASLACTATGFSLNALVTRNEDYGGAVLASILWRPKIMVRVAARHDVTMDAVWSMRTTKGVPIGHARTPPYPELVYPLTVTALIRN
jgi:hypothetical protein